MSPSDINCQTPDILIETLIKKRLSSIDGRFISKRKTRAHGSRFRIALYGVELST